MKRACIVCGKKTPERIYVGGVTKTGKQKSDPICSTRCFLKACALFLPTVQGRMIAKGELERLEGKTT